ncbi:MAG: type II toxin-antitoxin system HicB family antitoxin [Armatimonadetes bacterium]|nr:type II toxin-antitoxin system HicB family antitoxin [Armatimonadota bacterium]
MPTLDDYKIVLYRQSDGSWAAYVPAIDGCHAIMETRDAVLDELQLVFEMICEEYEEKGQILPADREIVCA